MSRVLVAISVLLLVSFSGCVSKAPRDDLARLVDEIRPAPASLKLPPMPACTLVAEEPRMPSLPATVRPTGAFSISIVYDDYSVPHVYADNFYELWYGNGYVQARERLFQMDALRLVGYGESARYLGAGQLLSDFEVSRDLYDRDMVAAQVAAAPAELVNALQAFSDGVNRYIVDALASGQTTSSPTLVLSGNLDPVPELPGEFPALGRVPPLWTVDDSFAIINYLIGYFGTDGGQEVANAKDFVALRDSLGSKEAAWEAYGDLNWLSVTDHSTAMPEKPVNGCEKELKVDEVPASQWEIIEAAADAVPFGIPESSRFGVIIDTPIDELVVPPSMGRGLFDGLKFGSNAMLVSSEMSETGKPIMWGAPQMGLYKPPIPFHVGLHSPDYDAVGMGVVGAPSVIIGRNAAGLAYSATSGNDDQRDMFALQLGKAPRSYVWDGVEKPMSCKIVLHDTFATPADLAGLLDGTPPGQPQIFEQEVCYIEGMPVVSWNQDAGYAFAMKSTTRNEEAPGAAIWFLLSTMKTLDEAKDLMQRFPFTFNMHMASEEGIQLVHTGNVPLRAKGYDVRFPLPGGSDTMWSGEVYGRNMNTWQRDPASGIITNWNNAPNPYWRAGDQKQVYGDVHRVEVIDRFVAKELAKDGKLSLADVERINEMSSIHDSLGFEFVPYLIAGANKSPNDYVRLAGAELLSWYQADLPWRDDNGDGLHDDAGFTIYEVAFTKLYDRVVGDELGDRTPQFDLLSTIVGQGGIGGGDPHVGDHGPSSNKFSILLDALQGETSHPWCDDVGTSSHESCLSILQQVMEETMQDLVVEYEGEPSTWLRPQHLSAFTAISAASGDLIPMLNRGSHVQFVAIGEGIEGSKWVLPPSNTGRLNSVELALALGGMPPMRVTKELACYYEFCYNPMPLTEAEVAATGKYVYTIQGLNLP